MNAGNIASEIVSAVSMYDLANYYGFRLNGGGFMCCPFHNEDTPSLKAYKYDKGFHCFGCGEHGDVIDFVEKYFQLGFWDACKKINDDFNLSLPIGARISLRQRRNFEHRQTDVEKQKALHEHLKAEYDRCLDEYAKIDKILMQGAGENPSKEFLEALANKSTVEYQLSRAEGELLDYEHKR